MRIIFLLLALVSGYATANTIDLDVGQSVNIGGTQITCGGSGAVTCPQVSCISYCSSYNVGKCLTYADFCGMKPYCKSSCAIYNGGRCMQYQDNCYEDKPSGC